MLFNWIPMFCEHRQIWNVQFPLFLGDFFWVTSWTVSQRGLTLCGPYSKFSPVRYNKRKCRVAKRWAITWLAFIDREGSKSKHMVFCRNIAIVALYALLRINICDKSLESNAFESITYTIIFWMVFFVWKALNYPDCTAMVIDSCTFWDMLERCVYFRLLWNVNKN